MLPKSEAFGWRLLAGLLVKQPGSVSSLWPAEQATSLLESESTCSCSWQGRTLPVRPGEQLPRMQKVTSGDSLLDAAPSGGRRS